MGLLSHWHWWEVVLATLGLTHITIAAVTIFLHRAQAHRAVELGAIPAHFFRFWLWLTTGMVTREWVAIHRKHHAKCETPEDPHSPQTHGLNTVTELRHQAILAESHALQTVFQFQQQLHQLWERTTASQEARLEAVQAWINAAEHTGIAALEQFAHRLRGYSVAT